MALSPDDKLLGEKMHYYCSSSEEEDNNEPEDNKEEEGATAANTGATFIPEPELTDYQGFCTNTGPKGVINDWRRYKQLETEKREEQEKERQVLLKKLSMTCRSQLDDEKEKNKDEKFLEEIERELDNLEDDFLKEYRQKRIEEMRKTLENVPKFGKVIPLRGDNFVEAIDKEQPQVTVIIHVYEDDVAACEAMNGCFLCLAQEYPTVKFCKLKASHARLSMKFAENGVPALLIYKKGTLIGNFIRLSNELGDDFYANDIESFLQEHGMLPTNNFLPGLTEGTSGQQGSDDSDFDID